MFRLHEIQAGTEMILTVGFYVAIGLLFLAPEIFLVTCLVVEGNP